MVVQGYNAFDGTSGGQASPSSTGGAAAAAPRRGSTDPFNLSATTTPPPARHEPIWVDFPIKDGSVKALDIAAAATRPFGFVYQDRVLTPLGPATVLGASHDGYLYFQIDNQSGASFWSTCTREQDFVQKGFQKIEAHEPPRVRAPESKAFHDIRTVNVRGRPTTVVMQALNGPCPVIALANALLLRGELPAVERLARSGNFINAEDLRDAVRSAITAEPGAPLPTFCESARTEGTFAALTQDAASVQTFRDMLRNDATARNLLLSFYDGLDVNPIFDTIDAFSADTKNALIFALAGVRMVHGWIMDPSADLADELRVKSYDELNIFEFDDAISAQHKAAAQQFLLETRSQLTEIGVAVLLSELADGEVCVLFHNNHFSTLMRMGDLLLTLVTDVAYLGRDGVVFEQLTVEGGGPHYDGDGTLISHVAMSVLDSFGRRFSVKEIDDAVGVLQSTNQGRDPTVADVASFIERKRARNTPPPASAAPVAPGTYLQPLPTPSPSRDANPRRDYVG